MNTKTLESLTRDQIAHALPHAIEKAIASYHNFSGQDNSETPKLFGDHHNACKAAIAHIELLLKLARWADIPTMGDKENEMEGILNRANHELKETDGHDA